ncbi:hypothetical protein [Brevundimonas sp.]|jgi:hypothetical protein|uniref:hypothetical protein n=1 Tax=Brevundimonas sp. TaxID=1871086 RepID=UPI0037846514
MSNEVDIITIEHTLRNIFEKEHIRSIDVTIANKLFAKWMVLTAYMPKDIVRERQSILDDEPSYQSRKR